MKSKGDIQRRQARILDEKNGKLFLRKKNRVKVILIICIYSIAIPVIIHYWHWGSISDLSSLAIAFIAYLFGFSLFN